MTVPTIRMHQVYFRRNQRRQLDPDFLPYDNTANLRPEWAEYGVFRAAYRQGRTREAQVVGFVSWRFGTKTGISGRQFLDFIAAHPGFDVYFINPYPYVSHMYRNPWLGLEDQEPGALAFSQRMVDQAGLRMDLAALPNDPERTGYSNYWAGTAAFWQRYMEFTEPVYQHLETGLTPGERAFLNGPANYAADSTRHPFIMERLFPTLLQMDPSIRALRYVHPPAEAAFHAPHFVALRDRIARLGAGQSQGEVEACINGMRSLYRDYVTTVWAQDALRAHRWDSLRRLFHPATCWPALRNLLGVLARRAGLRRGRSGTHPAAPAG